MHVAALSQLFVTHPPGELDTGIEMNIESFLPKSRT